MAGSEDFPELRKVLETEEVIPDTVFRHPSICLALRSNFVPAIEFLKTESALTALTKWCFDLTSLDKKEFTTMARTALRIFQIATPSVVSIFQESEVLADIFHTFLLSEASENKLLCGFFSQILIQQVMLGIPKIITMYDDFGVLLLKRIGNLAIQDLVVILATKTDGSVFGDINLIETLTEMALEESKDDHYCATALKQIFDDLSEDSKILEQYYSRTVVQNLANYALSCSSPLIASDLMEIVSEVIEDDDSLCDAIDGMKTDLMKPGVIDHFTTNTSRIFSSEILDPFNFFFEPKGYIFVHHYCSELLPTLVPQEIVELAQLPGFLDRMIDCWGTPKWCPHMTQLAMTFASVLSKCQYFHYDKWSSFVRDKFAGVMEVLESPFGGNVPDRSHCDYDIEEEEEEEYENL